MRLYQGEILFSPTDLVGFLGCRHLTFLSRQNLVRPVAAPEPDEQTELLLRKGMEHERGYLEQLQQQGVQVVSIDPEAPLQTRVENTRQALRGGAEVIYQGAFLNGRWHGFADFLQRTDGESSLGSYVYEPVDTKLSHSEKPSYILQLGIYAALLKAEQGKWPVQLHVQLGSGERFSVALREVQYYVASARNRFESYIDRLPEVSSGEPCAACGQCRWQERCESEWRAADHLSFVANITGSQIEKLSVAGITTLDALAKSAPGVSVPHLQPSILERLQSQARLQAAKRADDQNRCELLPVVEGKGFARMPRPDEGDLYFDMEGDPWVQDGLEYLFGFAYREHGAEAFTPFWGHDRAGEKQAFEQAMDFIAARLKRFPDAHIYHYAAYEETALKRLAMFHGTREAAVDNLLREGRLADLYRVVRESIRVSEPRYSIKNLETFYLPPREDAISTAGESVVVYERWRTLHDPQLLREIEDYNRTDCISTLKLHEWLTGLRPKEQPWYVQTTGGAEAADRTAEREAAEQRLKDTTARLVQVPPEELPFRELVGHLLEFHRRESKPQWWRQFQCAEMAVEELVEDAECLGGLERDPEMPSFSEKRSTVHTYRFPPQDFKLREGGRPRRAGSMASAGEIHFLDEAAGRIQLKIGPKGPPLEDALSLIPEPPIDQQVLRDAIYRYAQDVIDGRNNYPAITSILKAELPRLRGRKAGQPIVPDGSDVLTGAIRAVCDLDDSHLLVQGPPGAGKTFTSARAIIELLRQGKRVGIAAHSHKAINNLLAKVAEVAQEQGVGLRAVKKCSKDQEQECQAPGVQNVYDNKEVGGQFNLVAGTAWLFARPEMDITLDHLFIDEAGQVSLGNLVAMGLCARNIVLVGDQMQLSQPIQGVHPGNSSLSGLQYLLGDHSTVPPERGVFLDVTYRMHPDVCRFISEAVYDGRLHADPATENRRLVLGQGADPALKSTGLAFVEIEHEGCRQRSEPEARRVQELFQSLLKQRWVERPGVDRPLTIEDILVVSPYNMHVNLLQNVLPSGARVGTIDKFQGQEAPVVIVSMTSSSAEDVPRGLDFLYSRSRLNVAVSRAKSLAVIVASPRLLEATCTTVEQMKLVNTLCFAHAYSMT